MTDEKDIVEEAKLALSYYEKDDPEWPVYLVTRLIHEVEKLRSSNMVKEVAIGEYVKKIDSLTKERGNLEARNELSRIAYNQIEERIEKLKADNVELRHNFEQDRKVIANLKAQLSKSQKRVDQLIEQNRQRRLIDKNIRSLHYWHPAPDQTTYEEHATGKCSCGGKR